MLVLGLLLALCLPSSFALYLPPTLNTTELTEDNYKSLLDESDHLWMVFGYVPSCDACQEFVADDFDDLAKGFRGILKIGLVNTEEQTKLKKVLKLQKEPTLTFLDPISFPAARTYKGELMTEKIIDFAVKLLREKIERQAGIYNAKGRVVELYDRNFEKTVLESEEPWLVQFYAPWCPHCQKLGPIYAQLAKNFKHQLKFGSVDATSQNKLKERYGIKFFPTLKYFPASIEAKDAPKEFKGNYDKESITEWIRGLNLDADAMKIREITDEETLRETCERAPLCVISFLPKIYECETSCRQEYLNTTVKAAEKFRSYRWGWVWAEAGAQGGIEKALEVGGSGYPTMVAVNIKKMKYSVLRGSYTVKGIKEFLIGIASGKWEALPIKEEEMPKVETVKAWDGSDAILQHIHEESDAQIDQIVREEKAKALGVAMKDEL